MFAKIVMLYNGIDEIDTTESVTLSQRTWDNESTDQFMTRVYNEISHCQHTCSPVYVINLYLEEFNLSNDGTINWLLSDSYRGLMMGEK